jgi:tetratricopeptide (TPR) repeat protein
MGTGFDAIRFSSSVDSPKYLLWACAYDARPVLNTYLTACSGELMVVNAYTIRNRLALDRVDLPDENTLALNQLPSAQIRPGEEYYLHFAFSDQRPREVFVKLKLVSASVLLGTDPAEHLAAALGIPVPLTLNASAPLSDRVYDLVSNGRSAEALALVERAIQTAPVPRTTRMLHAYALQGAAYSIEQSGDREAATRRYLQAAQVMRELKAEFGELTEDESSVYAEALYNEACCQSLAGQFQDSIRTLQQALELGFRPSTPIAQQTALDPLRDMPEYKQLVSRMRSRGPLRRTGTDGKAAQLDWRSYFSGVGGIALVVAIAAAWVSMAIVILRGKRAARVLGRLRSPGAPRTNRRHFRFSVRTLAIVITLVCLYLGCWEITRRYGVRPNSQSGFEFRQDQGGMVYAHPTAFVESSPMPFVICRRAFAGDARRYLLWMFGHEYRLFDLEQERDESPPAYWLGKKRKV